ncbi:hypothetical protein GCM10028819_39510 [Spirosoma humi]
MNLKNIYNEMLSLRVDVQLIKFNQIELADTIRLLLHQHYPEWFERLSYEDDRSFLEPALFYLFSEKSSLNIPIGQLLFGHISKRQRPDHVISLSDPFGEIYLGNYGSCSGNPVVDFMDQLRGPIKEMNWLSDSIQLNEHTPFILYIDKSGIVNFTEPVIASSRRSEKFLRNAISILQDNVPEFWEIVELVTREISLFNSKTSRSMAAISYHGTAFINTEGQPNDEVFFIEDLAHQCGHIIFYALTLQTHNFLKPAKDTLLKKWTGLSYDTRSIYGALHGLFTYTTILHCLTRCLKLDAFNASQRVEALARVGFFMKKFELDLQHMHLPEIFTPQGQQVYDAAFSSFEYVRNEFGADYKGYRYHNQPYIFNYDLFRQANA